MAGNQQGKSICGAAETAFHLTGDYPDDWQGLVFRRPIRAWASGVTHRKTRDVVQWRLFGKRGNLGSGFIPGEAIVGKPTFSRGLGGLIDTAEVRHVSGGTSTIAFMSYDMDVDAWASDPLDWIWFDEEPPERIYSEGLSRLTATRGSCILTFTPLLGMSEVVNHFYPAPDTGDRYLTHMTIEDAQHIPAQERQRIMDRWPPHEREARAMGVPMLGSGRVFPIPEQEIRCKPFEIPPHWYQIGGMDYGWDHPFAAIRMAWDREQDEIYITQTWKKRHATTAVVLDALRAWETWLPWAWPHDLHNKDRTSGEEIANIYRRKGLRMLSTHATHEAGGFGVEASIVGLMNYMERGAFHVFDHLGDWFDEYRNYHRKDGEIAKIRDDLMSATMKAYMMKRFARPKVNSVSQPQYAASSWDPLSPSLH